MNFLYKKRSFLCSETMRPITLSSIFCVLFLMAFSIDIEDEIRIIHPRIIETTSRRQRYINNNVPLFKTNQLKIVEIGDWTIELYHQNNVIVKSNLQIEWINDSDDENVILQPIQKCNYRSGIIRGFENLSNVILTICNNNNNNNETMIIGYLNLNGIIFYIEPIDIGNGAHKLYRTRRKKRYISSMDAKWLFNLTGDTMDIGDEIDSIQPSFDKDLMKLDDAIVIENMTDTLIPIDEDWHPEQLDQDELGYFYDTAWIAESPIIHKSSGNVLPERWLEIAIGIDHTLIGFHGKDKVTAYVLALMNIVNAIYQDASLEANMKLVVTRLLIYEHKRQSVVRPGNAKKSLENVNSWNNRLHRALAPGESHHDIAIWLTRSDIGGPSGYAPVAGACDPKRSCALNRDEGLSSAFIIAHEMAHVLGLSHDGDRKTLNYCDKEALKGSVMAPLVASTFSKFTWSECSRGEFKNIIKKWSCLLNPPPGSGEIVLNATLQNAFSMDEQCRMEFGEGYTLCRAFDIIEPCSHLWCGHVQSPLVCKTKKGSPLEGTQCGHNKWCINGYCQDIEHQQIGKTPILLNPQDGGWSIWGAWGSCSRSCGIGIQFRIRKCDNPQPLYGGRNCEGASEEWRVCNQQVCPLPFGDLRAQQCRRLAKLLNLERMREGNMTWLPYESEQMDKKCKLICVSEETKEVYRSSENLIDGTPCSYENTDNICIQGVCQLLGCDGQLSSNKRTDLCGECGGNNSNCTTIKSNFHKKLKREVTRIAVFPRMATTIQIHANVTIDHNNDEPSVAFILKNRKKKKYTITIPNSRLRTEIIEGTKFYYEKQGNKHKIWAKGPVLAEMVVLVYAPISEIQTGLNISLYSEYIIHKETQTISNRYKWILGGWGPCSVSCGGGRRQQTVACWDVRHEKLVRRKHCSLLTKPELESGKCNEFECDFQWIAAKWEPCSATCGLKGIQHRELYCIPQPVLNNILLKNNVTIVEEPWKYMVNPQKCSGIMPQSTRACNREPCFSYWTYGEWSQCSTSCGKGVSLRSSYCPPPYDENFFTCGEAPPPNERRICYGATRYTNPLCRGRKRKHCLHDQSIYCSLAVLSKYCKINGFRRLCCKSCLDFLLSSVAI